MFTPTTNKTATLTTKNRILCYIRPWNYAQFFEIAQKAFPEAKVVQCSEHKSVDSSGLCKNYYSALNSNNNNSDFKQFLYSEGYADDIIYRCRLLRNIDKAKAVKHMEAMALSMENLFERYSPKCVLSLTVDSFIIDLLWHCCLFYEISFIGIVPTFINGYFRVTAKGEKNINPNPHKLDHDEIVKELTSIDYTPRFIAQTSRKPRKTVIERWLKDIARIPFFYFKRLITRDPYNYHYWYMGIRSKEFVRWLPVKEPGHNNWQSIVAKDPRPTLYIPLQMFPECTVDYWAEDIRLIEYYKILDELIERHHKSFHIVIKEHPGVLGYRPRGFYRNLRKDKRISVIPTYTPSNLVVNLTDSVLVWTGSVGFQAALLGKPVFTLCEPYYAEGLNFLKITPDTDSQILLDHITKIKQISSAKNNSAWLIKQLSIQLFKGDFKNDGKWDPEKENDRQNAENIGAGIHSYWQSLHQSIDSAIS